MHIYLWFKFNIKSERDASLLSSWTWPNCARERSVEVPNQINPLYVCAREKSERERERAANLKGTSEESKGGKEMEKITVRPCTHHRMMHHHNHPSSSPSSRVRLHLSKPVSLSFLSLNPNPNSFPFAPFSIDLLLRFHLSRSASPDFG